MKEIDPGALDRRVSIWRSVTIDDGTATVKGEPAEIGARWAKRTDISDGERVRAQQLGQELTTRFLVRSDPLTRTINGADRLICEGRVFFVTGTKEWGGARVGIEITTSSQPDTQTGG